MRIALVDGTPKPKVYSYALLKLGAWRKDLGDTCVYHESTLPESGRFDEIWISTLFTFDIPHALGLIEEALRRADRVRVGGIAATMLPEYFRGYDVDVHRGFVEEAEHYHPDYTLLPKRPSYSIAHTSRGCIRHCEFCMLHILEPEFEPRPEWKKDLCPGAEKIVFYDNNWLAKDIELIRDDVTKLKRLVHIGRIKTIDFNQALDCRLLTEEKADLIADLPVQPWRFAFDTMRSDGHFQRAICLMVERGAHVFINYALYNFEDTPADFYYRLKENARLSEELKAAVDVFPMMYRPTLEPDVDKRYVGTHWTKQMKDAFLTIRRAMSGPAGTISTHSHKVEEFEYWFGKDAGEFERLLTYPKIKLLMKRRKGALRLKRREEKTHASVVIR